jgi:hypothetical protein
VPPPPYAGASEQLSQVSYRQPQPYGQGYAPQFEGYAPAAGPPPPSSARAQSGYGQPEYAQQGYDPLQNAQAGYGGGQPPLYAQPAAGGQRAALPAFDQWAPPAGSDQHGTGYGQPAPQQEPAYRHLDPQLSGASYPPAGYPPHDSLHHQQHAAASGGSLQGGSDWGQHSGYAPAEPSLDGGYRIEPQQGYQQDPAAQHEPAEIEEDDYEVEEASSGRFMRIAAALVGAIVVGGGLAFAYTQLMTGDSATPQLIKSAAGPNKVKPADPGGKKFSNSESKLMGRLNDGAAGESAPADSDASGVKKVATVKVGANGEIIPPAEQPAESASAPAPAAGADDSFPSAGTTYAAPAPAAEGPVAEGPVKVTPPKTIDKSIDKVMDTAVEAPAKAVAQLPAKIVAEAPAGVSDTTTNSIAAAANVTKPAPPAVKKVAAPAPALGGATAPPPAVKKPVVAAPVAGAGSAGYVAVLASVPVSNTSRIAALKQFADMQQKYGTLLQNKAPEVKEANLGEKGVYHRLLVGPPGSREGAQSLCGSLKQAGYGESCWVTAY